MPYKGKKTHPGQERSALRKRKRRLIKQRIQRLPPFAVSDKALWNNFVQATAHDVIAGFIVRYVARLAHLLESKMHAGEKLEDIFELSKVEADTEYLSGYQTGTAVHLLELIWEDKISLRRLNATKWLFAGEPEILGGLSNENELVELVPSRFKKNNDWSGYAMHIFLYGGCIDNWKWRTTDQQAVLHQLACFHGIIGSFGIGHKEKIAISGWMLSEMLEEVPNYANIAG